MINLRKVIKQANWWKYLAWSLPLIYLAGLFLLEIFGFKNIVSEVVVIGGIFFFCIAVIWWWWAIQNIITVLSSMQVTNKKLLDVIKELKFIRKDLK